MENLGQVIAEITMKGALAYLTEHNLKPASNEALIACVKSWAKFKLNEAIHDYEEAMSCGMEQQALMTFNATFVLAGIEAAKECSLPI